MKVEKANLLKNQAGIDSAGIPKIERVKLTQANDRVNLSSNMSFTGNTENIVKLIPGYKNIERLMNLDWLRGELGGILLTAIGTGFVAPISIIFNPFMKAPKDATPEEKKNVADTKAYTGMRQPVSAATALLCQGPIQKLIDRGLDVLFNVPQYSKKFSIANDQSVLNSKSYIETKIKKENKLNGIKLSEKELKKAVEDEQTRQLNILADDFYQTGKLKIGERYLDNNTIAELINKQIDEYITDAQKLKYDRNALSYYNERAQILMNNKTHLREIFGDADKFGRTKDGYKNLENYLKNILQQEESADVKKLIEEVLRLPDELRAYRMNNTLKRIRTINKLCGKDDYSPRRYLRAMTDRNAELDNIITELDSLKFKDIDKIKKNQINISDNDITNKIRKIREACSFRKDNKFITSILNNTDTFDSNGERLLKKIYKDITKGYKNLCGDKFKCFSMIFKIGIGVFTMLISCDVLNWAYPRFMDLFFPRLSGVKKAKDGGDK